MKSFRRVIAASIIGATILALTSTTVSGARTQSATVILVTHDSFSISKSVLRDFTRESEVLVKLLPLGDAGVALNQAILTKDQPLGDVLYGVDTTFLSRGIDAEIFEPYRAANIDQVSKEFKVDKRFRVTPIDYGDVCINYDKDWFAQKQLSPPKTLTDLTKSRYRNLLVVENPATSSPGLAFLLATIARFGATDWIEYWRALRANGVEVTDGWETAYNGSFSAGEGGGERPLVVSYASSPAAAVYYSDPQPSTAPIGTMLDSCFRQTEFAGILRGTDNRKAAEKLIDFMLTRKFQEDIPLQMFVFPVTPDAQLPAVFKKFAEVAPNPASMSPSRISRHREQWIADWTEAVLR